MFSNKIFSERLLLLRTTAKVNQSTLAAAIGLAKSSISLMESCKRAASIEMIYAIADYFDVSIDYLVGRSDDPKRY